MDTAPKKNPTAAFGCDHAGFEFKSRLTDFIKRSGYEVVDCGTDSAASVDYPVIADKVCKQIQSGTADMGILVCGTGIGMSIAANKHKGIRAAVCWRRECADLARRHNDANVLCLGARMLDASEMENLIAVFLSSGFEGGRHKTRVDMLNALDGEQ